MKGKNSLAPVAAELKSLLGDAFIGLSPDCIGDAVEAQVAAMQPGQVHERASP